MTHGSNDSMFLHIHQHNNKVVYPLYYYFLFKNIQIVTTLWCPMLSSGVQMFIIGAIQSIHRLHPPLQSPERAEV